MQINHNQNRKIATVADKNIEEELDNFVRSLRAHGWDGNVYIFCPSNSQPEIPEGCEKIGIDPWWGMIKKQYPLMTNGTALLKPYIFSSDFFSKNDIVMYMDSADLLVGCDPNDIFDIAEGKVWTARILKDIYFPRYVPDQTMKKFGLQAEDKINEINSGVMIARITDRMEDICSEVDKILKDALKDGPMLHGIRAGDQVIFSYFYDKLYKEGKAGDLPGEYNYRGLSEFRNISIEDGKLYGIKNKRVYVPHASGTRKIYPSLIKACCQDGD